MNVKLHALRVQQSREEAHTGACALLVYQALAVSIAEKIEIIVCDTVVLISMGTQTK